MPTLPLTTEQEYGIKRILSSLVVAVCLLTSLIHAQEPSGTLRGVVLDLSSRAPISGAAVIAVPSHDAHRFARGATSASDGSFEITGLVSDTYRVSAQKPGYIEASSMDTVVVEERPVPHVTKDGRLEIQLIRHGVITGTIVDDVGQPLPLASVEVMEEAIVGDQIELVKVAQTNANDVGEYRIWGLRSGAYYVSAHYRDDPTLLGLNSKLLPDGSTRLVAFSKTFYPAATTLETASGLSKLAFYKGGGGLG